MLVQLETSLIVVDGLRHPPPGLKIVIIQLDSHIEELARLSPIAAPQISNPL
jgi:hypothetical protein